MAAWSAMRSGDCRPSAVSTIVRNAGVKTLHRDPQPRCQCGKPVPHRVAQRAFARRVAQGGEQCRRRVASAAVAGPGRRRAAPPRPRGGSRSGISRADQRGPDPGPGAAHRPGVVAAAAQHQIPRRRAAAAPPPPPNARCSTGTAATAGPPRPRPRRIAAPSRRAGTPPTAGRISSSQHRPHLGIVEAARHRQVEQLPRAVSVKRAGERPTPLLVDRDHQHVA